MDRLEKPSEYHSFFQERNMKLVTQDGETLALEFTNSALPHIKITIPVIERKKDGSLEINQTFLLSTNSDIPKILRDHVSGFRVEPRDNMNALALMLEFTNPHNLRSKHLLKTLPPYIRLNHGEILVEAYPDMLSLTGSMEKMNDLFGDLSRPEFVTYIKDVIDCRINAEGHNGGTVVRLFEHSK